MKKLLFLLIPIIILSSCVTQKACQDKFPCLTDTTTKIQKITHDSTVFIPADESWLWALIQCDSNNQALLDSLQKVNGKKSKITYIIQDNPNGKGKIIYVNCHCDSASIALKWDETHKITNANKTQIIYERTKFADYMRYAILILALILAIILFLWLKKITGNKK